MSWSSRLQGVVSRSSTEAEFYAASMAGTEIKWLRHLLGEIGRPVTSPSPLFIDNQGCINGLKDVVALSRMKHIPVAEFWIQDEVSKVKSISVHHLRTDSMPADLLTKPLTRELVERHRQAMGLL